MANFSNSTQATAGSVAPGAARYMAPELFENGRKYPQSDIYAFGILIFEVSCWTCLQKVHLTPPTALRTHPGMFCTNTGGQKRRYLCNPTHESLFSETP